MSYQSDCLAMGPTAYWQLSETSGVSLADASGNGNTATIKGYPFDRYRAWVLSMDPTLYWPLDSTGLATDQSGSGYNGTGAGGITLGGFAGSPITGESTSTAFDNSNDVVSSTYGPFVNGGAITVCGWAYRDGTTTDTLFCSSSLTANNQTLLRLENGSQDVKFWAQVGLASPITWSNAWLATQWVHFALVFDEAQNLAKLYVNGSLVSSQAETDQYHANPGFFQIGNRAFNSDPFGGKMAHVSVHDRALSAAEILTLKNAGTSSSVFGVTYDQQGGSRDLHSGALKLDGNGTYVQADAYSPFVANAQRTFVLFLKANHGSWSIKNIFGGSGTQVDGVSNDMKFPVLETAPLTAQGDNFRWYHDIDAQFPLNRDWPNVPTPLGKWMHIALVVDDSLSPSADAVILWVNGVNKGPVTVGWPGGGPFPAEAGKFMFGVRHAIGGVFQEFHAATYDEVAIFERLLTDTEIQTLAGYRRA